jgi:hypothetical protein
MKAVMSKDTYFLPPDRSSSEELHKQFEEITSNQTINDLLKPDALIAILNKNRQIVCVNNYLQEYTKNKKIKFEPGVRLGELFYCTHSTESSGGCGTSLSCMGCPAAQSMSRCFSGEGEQKGVCIFDSKDPKIYDSIIIFTFDEIEVNGSIYYIIKFDVKKD